MSHQVIDVDFLILGSGVSGLYSALLLSEFGEVLIATKEKLTESNTSYAQGGIASVLAGTDSFESHIRDTLGAGAGLCDRQAVEVLVREGPAHIRRLMDLGANFARGEDGELDLGREGGHSVNRIVHSADYTGREIEQVLEKSILDRKIRVLEYHCAVELITSYHLCDVSDPTSEEPRCYGAYLYDRKSWDIFVVRARAVILATGGAGQVYPHSTNPPVSTGDGVAMAYRAGAVISNMEFFQFHPTALYAPGTDRSFLISEALRGFGGILRGPDGNSFMGKYDSRRDLAPRDIVARAIDSELKRTGADHVFLDVTHKKREDLMARFPSIYSHCLEVGIDISREMIPVVPAAHYMCGGVRTDLNGHTNIKDLFVVGEAACTGVHGGNRLASNSLLEGLVFASRIAASLKDKGGPTTKVSIRVWDKEGLENAEEWILVSHNLEEVRHVMWDYVGIVRSDLRLNRALRRLNLLYEEVEDFYRRTVIQNKILELRNITQVARLIIKSALLRRESRGLHYNTDYPESREPSSEYTELQRGI